MQYLMLKMTKNYCIFGMRFNILLKPISTPAGDEFQSLIQKSNQLSTLKKKSKKKAFHPELFEGIFLNIFQYFADNEKRLNH